MFAVKAEAASDSIDDQAGLFSAEEISSLSEEIGQTDALFGGSLYVVTTNTNSQSVQDYAENYLAGKIGNKGHGAILVIDMGQRMLHIATYGNIRDFVGDNKRESMADNVQEDMKDGDYYGAAQTFVSQTKSYIQKYNGGHYHFEEGTGNVVAERYISWIEALIAFAVASTAALAFFFVNQSRYHLKMGKEKYDFRANSALNLTEQSDDFVNSFITTRHIPRNNNSNGGGGSSGGGGFGGSSRSF